MFLYQFTVAKSHVFTKLCHYTMSFIWNTIFFWWGGRTVHSIYHYVLTNFYKPNSILSYRNTKVGIIFNSKDSLTITIQYEHYKKSSILGICGENISKKKIRNWVTKDFVKRHVNNYIRYPESFVRTQHTHRILEWMTV